MRVGGCVVQDLKDLPGLSGYQTMVLDTETSGLSPHHGDRICGLCLGPLDEDWSVYIPIRHTKNLGLAEADPRLISSTKAPADSGVLPAPPEPFKNLNAGCVFRWLKPFLRDPGRRWVMHNAIFDLGVLRAEGLDVAGEIFDTLSAAHVLNGALPSYSLDALTRAFKLLPGHAAYTEVDAWLRKNQPRTDTWIGKLGWNFSQVPIELLGRYGCEDIHATRLLARYLLKTPLSAHRQTNSGNRAWTQQELRDHEMRLVRVLFEMTWVGVRMDLERCVQLRDDALNEAEAYQQGMYDLAGYAFNIGSWKQLWEAFESVGGRVRYWMCRKGDRGKQKMDHFTEDRERSTGRPCWNAAAILKYLAAYSVSDKPKAFQFLQCYREAMQRQRLVSTYLDAYLQLTDPQGFLHGSFKAHGTVTGRLSSANPNMQNITKTKGNADAKALDEYMDSTESESLGRQLRGLFLARPGCQLVSIDYSQIEYRTAAYFSADPVLLEKYRSDLHTDYHQATADMVGVSRDLAKTLNFGTLYGMGAKGLASALTGMGKGTSKDEAQEILNNLFQKRPALKKLIDDTAQAAGRVKVVANPFGRRCPVPSDGFSLKSYVALNYWVQGTCGDLMRRAMVRVSEAIRARDWPVLMLLTVHDELIFDIPTSLVVEVAPEIAAIMCDVPELGIPLLCDIEVGPSWGEQISLADWVKSQNEPEKCLL